MNDDDCGSDEIKPLIRVSMNNNERIIAITPNLREILIIINQNYAFGI